MSHSEHVQVWQLTYWNLATERPGRFGEISEQSAGVRSNDQQVSLRHHRSSPLPENATSVFLKRSVRGFLWTNFRAFDEGSE
jgi:hypothetical protein